MHDRTILSSLIECTLYEPAEQPPQHAFIPLIFLNEDGTSRVFFLFLLDEIHNIPVIPSGTRLRDKGFQALNLFFRFPVFLSEPLNILPIRT